MGSRKDEKAPSKFRPVLVREMTSAMGRIFDHVLPSFSPSGEEICACLAAILIGIADRMAIDPGKLAGTMIKHVVHQCRQIPKENRIGDADGEAVDRILDFVDEPPPPSQGH